ncbi:hypothetical protein ACE38W_03910 [Chitinophaga sp. Hz27]|uniref:hypothetical protein n=1 Tax=Chitinophaga sp. Hz27 TaxID=3347169 RepID=UPI0035D952C5
MRILVIGGIVIGVGFALFILIYVTFPSRNADVHNEVIALQSSNGKSHIYLKKKVWGMTSDNQVIVISNSAKKDFEPNKNADYFYPGLVPFLYKFNRDTLFIYTLERANVPPNFHSDIHVIQNIMDSPELYKLYDNESYRKLGISLLSR